MAFARVEKADGTAIAPPSVVVARYENGLALGQETDLPQWPPLLMEQPRALSVGWIDSPDRSVHPDTDERNSIRTEGEGSRRSSVQPVNLGFLRLFRSPGLDGDVVAARKDQAGLRLDRHRAHRPVVAAADKLFLAALLVPDPDGRIFAAADQAAIPTESQTGDGGGVAATHLPQRERFCIPQLDQSISAAAGQQAAIRTERQRGSLTAVGLESMYRLRFVRVEDHHFALCSCLLRGDEGSSQPATIARPGQGHAALLGAARPAANHLSLSVQEEQTARLADTHAGRHGQHGFARVVGNRCSLSQSVLQARAKYFAGLGVRAGPQLQYNQFS